MARHNHSDGQPQSWSDALIEESQSLAEEYELQHESLLVCLTRLADAFSQPCDRNADRVELPRSSIRLLRDAITAIGTEAGVRLIEAADPLALENRIWSVEYLCKERTPYHSLNELQAHLRQFQAFVGEIESFLVHTGLPRWTFTDSPWLFLHLGRLYDTRRTSSPCPIVTIPPLRLPPYTWVRHPADDVPTPEEYENCEYEDADFLRGLNIQDAMRLERGRSQFLAPRSAVIDELIRSCKNGEAEGLLERCLEILDNGLDRETIQFLLRMDVFYLGSNALDREFIDVTPSMSPGGLTNLLEVVGHVESELRCGMFDRMKRNISKDLFEAVFDAENREDPAECYLKATLRSDCDALDEALDDFYERLGAGERHWTDFSHRLAKWLDPDFRVRVGIDVRPEYADRLAPLIREFVRYQESKADDDEPLVAVPPSDAPNVFQHSESSWTITFDGQTVARPDKDGYFYIAQLLSRPGTSIDPFNLRCQISAWKNPPDSPRRVEDNRSIILASDRDAESSEALTVSPRDAGFVADQHTLREYRECLKLLEQQIVDAKEAGDGPKMVILQDEYDQIFAHLQASTDHHNRPRRQSSDSKIATDSVRNAIERALADIESVHKALHQHLARYLKYGVVCRYEPPTPINWKL